MHDRKNAIKIYSWWKGDVVGELVNTFSTRVADDGGVVEATDCLATRIQTLRSKGLWDRASAVWMPHAYKESKLYAVKGGAGLDLGFTRAGTRYRTGPTYVERVPANVVARTEDFDNAYWQKTNATIVANAIAAPDGTLTADLMYPTTTGTFRGLRDASGFIVGAGNNYKIRICAKAQNKSWISILNPQGGSGAAWFDLATGTAHNNNAISASIEDMGDGWYDCSIIDNSTNTSGFYYIMVVDGNGSSTATTNGTDGVYIWGASYALNGTAPDYFKITDRFNIPGLDYTGVTCPQLSVEPARTNLFWNSEDLTNAYYTKSGVTVTGNAAVAPDGTITADKVIETGTGFHYLWRNNTWTGVYTCSIYVKAAERFRGQFYIVGTAASVNFNLQTGVTTGSGSMQNVGNGWYRIYFTTESIPPATVAAIQLLVFADDGTPSYTGDGVSGYYAWGFQVESGAYLSSYMPTGSAATTSRIADTIPALLPKGTNIALHSEAIDNAAWVKSLNVGATANATLAPNGTLTADKYTETAVNGNHYGAQTISKVAAAIPYTASIYIKAAERTRFRFGCANAALTDQITGIADLSAGTISGPSKIGTGMQAVSVSLVDVGSGWYRATVSCISNSEASILFLIQLIDNTGAASYQGVAGQGLYVWGAQLEQGDEATTYVATTTVPVHNGTVIGQAAGTLYWEGNTFPDSTVKTILCLSDNSLVNTIKLRTNSSNEFQAQIVTGSGIQAQITSSPFVLGTDYKIAVCYGPNRCALVVNGVKVAEDLTVTVPATFKISFDRGDTATEVFYGNTKVKAVLPTALTDAEAIALTTP